MAGDALLIAAASRPFAQTERVLHVMWSLNIGGAERALYQLVQGQRAAGMDVGLLVGGALGLYGERLKSAGVRVESLGQRRGFQVASTLQARAIFRQWPVIHFHVAEPLLMLAAASTPGRMYYSHRAGSFEYPLLRRLRYRATGVVVRRRFEGLVGNTAHAADAAARLFRIPRYQIGVVYNGLDWSLLAPERSVSEVRAELGLPPDAVAFGTSGNLRGWKRTDLAFRAMQRVGPSTVLVVIGDGPERLPLERLAAELSISDRIRFTGKKANVADYLQILDAFLLPSGPEESFGNAAVEAMGFALPTIVMRDGGGLTEHVVHGRTGVVAKDVEDLAYWMTRLVEDAELRRSLGARARESTRARYTIEQMASGYSDLYSHWAPRSPVSAGHASTSPEIR